MTSAGYLISRAAEQPAILSLTTVIVAVRFFGLARPLARYLERLASHDLAFRVLSRLRDRFYERIEPLAPAELERTAAATSSAGWSATSTRSRACTCAGSARRSSRSWRRPRVGVAAAILPAAALVLAAGLVVGGSPSRSSPGALARTLRPRARARARGAHRRARRAPARRSGARRLRPRGRGASRGSRRPTPTPPGAARRDALVAGVADGLAVAVTGLTTGRRARARRRRARRRRARPRARGDARAARARVVRGGGAAAAGGARARGDARGRAPRARAHRSGAGRPRSGRARRPRRRGVPTVALEDVAARYPSADEPVLVGFDLTLEPGQRLALVGPSGAGKTTVANLLLRFLDPVAGRVTLDGRDLRELRQEDVRRTFAVAGQDAHLFATSIRENLRIGRPEATDEDVDAALGRVRLGDWVASLPDGPTRSSARRERSSPAASGSASSSRAPFSPTRRCSSSTSRRHISTRRPPRRSSATSWRRRAIAPCS